MRPLIYTEAASNETKRYRDTGTGRYAFWNNFERICTCGHTLGVHCAGGFDCLAGTGVLNDPTPKVLCACKKFKQSRKRNKGRGK